MVKYIIHAADIHIRNMRRHEETIEQLSKFVKYCKDFVSEHGADETRIVLCGDIVHQKITISAEQQILLNWFFKQLDKIAITFVIAGNHDFLMGNKDRIDALTPVFKMTNYKKVHYLDKELDYESGTMADGNVLWALYSAFSNFSNPNIESALEGMEEKPIVIGLYHGDIVGSKTDMGRVSDVGLSGASFQGCDYVIAGHIHKRQELKQNGIPIVYSGSLIQQDYSENVTGHGFVVWDLEKGIRENVDIPSDYGYYHFEIKDIKDIEEDKERLVNL